MKVSSVKKVLKDLNYIRVGGTKEELAAAEYLRDCCEEIGAKAYLESFEVQMSETKEEHLYADGVEITCKAFRCCGSGEAEAPLCYLPNIDSVSLLKAKGKIVLLDGGINRFLFKDLMEQGVKGIITYSGDVNYRDNDIDLKELRSYVCEGVKVPCVNINAKDALRLVKMAPKQVRIVVEQNEWMGQSQDVIAEIPGCSEEWICFTAHYDSTPLSHGIYDNLTGCIALMEIMEEMLKKAPHRYGLRFIFCGSEERGLLGSKAYVKAHEEELSKVALDINLDMVGSVMGKFISCVTAEENLVTYVKYLASELGWGIHAYQGVYSSDSTPFADKGVPAISFARWAGDSQAPIHVRYDTEKVVSVEQILADAAFITAFTQRMADAALCPVSKTMPDKLKDDLDKYLMRKRRN